MTIELSIIIYEVLEVEIQKGILVFFPSIYSITHITNFLFLKLNIIIILMVLLSVYIYIYC